jgi:hypothetical protein
MYQIKTNGVALIDANSNLTSSELVRLYGVGLKKGETYDIVCYCRVDANKNIPEYIGVLFVDKKGNEVIIGIASATGVYFTPDGKGDTDRKQVTGSCIDSTAKLVELFGKSVTVKDFQEVKVLRYGTDKVTTKRMPIFELPILELTEVTEVTEELTEVTEVTE